MVAAKIPAITIPARKGTKNSADINIKIFSESLGKECTGEDHPADNADGYGC